MGPAMGPHRSCSTSRVLLDLLGPVLLHLQGPAARSGGNDQAEPPQEAEPLSSVVIQVDQQLVHIDHTAGTSARLLRASSN